MHEAYSTLVGSSLVQEMQDGRQNVEDVARLEDVEQEFLVVLAELPEEDQELLMEVDFPLGIRQVGVRQRIHKQPRDSF